MGYIKAWQEKYNEARKQFNYVLTRHPDRNAARIGIIKVERWSKRYNKALHHAKQGLQYEPNNTELLYQKALVLYFDDQHNESLNILKRLTKVKPNDPKINSLINKNKDALHPSRRYALFGSHTQEPRFELSFNHEWSRINNLENDWHLSEIAYSRKSKYLTLIGQINLARRFGQKGKQYLIDAYIKWPDRGYVFLDYGYSSDNLFPKDRYAIEPFIQLPYSSVVSFGVRKLKFTDSAPTIWTGSIAKYIDNYYAELRTFLRKQPQEISRTFIMRLRRYFGGRNHYFALNLGYGSGPDLSNLNPEDLSSVRDKDISIKYVTPLWNKNIVINVGAEYEVQDFPNNSVRRFETIRSGIEYLIK